MQSLRRSKQQGSLSGAFGPHFTPISCSPDRRGLSFTAPDVGLRLAHVVVEEGLPNAPTASGSTAGPNSNTTTGGYSRLKAYTLKASVIHPASMSALPSVAFRCSLRMNEIDVRCGTDACGCTKTSIASCT